MCGLGLDLSLTRQCAFVTLCWSIAIPKRDLCRRHVWPRMLHGVPDPLNPLSAELAQNVFQFGSTCSFIGPGFLTSSQFCRFRADLANRWPDLAEGGPDLVNSPGCASVDPDGSRLDQSWVEFGRIWHGVGRICVLAAWGSACAQGTHDLTPRRMAQALRVQQAPKERRPPRLRGAQWKRSDRHRRRVCNGLFERAHAPRRHRSTRSTTGCRA